MSGFDELRRAIPAWVEDLRLNLATLEQAELLTPRHVWGCALTCAHASGEPRLIELVAGPAAALLAPHERAGAASVAAIMAQNAIWFRFTDALAHEQPAPAAAPPSRLRMQVLGKPGVARLDYELWCVAAAAIHGCEACMRSHARAVLAAGGTLAHAHAAVRVAAIFGGIAQALLSAPHLAES